MDCKYKTKEEYNEFMEKVESAIDCSADVAGTVGQVLQWGTTGPEWVTPTA